jgi:hypothetical protein
MNKYRFKTLSEFESEFGVQWRRRVLYSFPPHMNYLLGKDYYKELSDFDYENGFIDKQDGYSICKSMLVKKNIIKTPNYKPRIINRTIDE